MLEANIKYFKDRVKEYEVTYLRFDEDYVANKYFTKKGASILVLGCGAGRTLMPLQKKGFRVTGIDIVPEMVKACKKRIKNLPIKVELGDAKKLRFKEKSIDYIIFPFHGMDNIYPDIYKVVRESARILKDDGVFIFNSENRFYIKKLKDMFRGKYAKQNSMFLYRSTALEYFKLKKFFKKVKIQYRISMLDYKKANWKDICYKILPFFSKSIYFICKDPIYDNL